MPSDARAAAGDALVGAATESGDGELAQEETDLEAAIQARHATFCALQCLTLGITCRQGGLQLVELEGARHSACAGRREQCPAENNAAAQIASWVRQSAVPQCNAEEAATRLPALGALAMATWR